MRRISPIHTVSLCTSIALCAFSSARLYSYGNDVSDEIPLRTEKPQKTNFFEGLEKILSFNDEDIKHFISKHIEQEVARFVTECKKVVEKSDSFPKHNFYSPMYTELTTLLEYYEFLCDDLDFYLKKSMFSLDIFNSAHMKHFLKSRRNKKGAVLQKLSEELEALFTDSFKGNRYRLEDDIEKLGKTLTRDLVDKYTIFDYEGAKKLCMRSYIVGCLMVANKNAYAKGFSWGVNEKCKRAATDYIENITALKKDIFSINVDEESFLAFIQGYLAQA